VPRAAASHTGSLAVADAVFDAVLRQHGVLRARNEEQMLDMLQALAQTAWSRRPGLGIATQSGGAGVMMADRAEELGLAVPDADARGARRTAGGDAGLRRRRQPGRRDGAVRRPSRAAARIGAGAAGRPRRCTWASSGCS
jgi:hypothetical protein